MWPLLLPPTLPNPFSLNTALQVPALTRKEYFPQQLHCLLFLPRLVVGAPLETNGHQKTGDVYKCPVIPGNCTKLNLGNLGFWSLHMRPTIVRAGQALKHNPCPQSHWFLAAAPEVTGWYYCPILQRRKLKPERGNNFPTVTQLVRGQPGFKPRPLESQAIALPD